MATEVLPRIRRSLGLGKAALLLPAVALYGALFLMPLLKVIFISFDKKLANYSTVLSSPIFPRVIENTLVISATTTVIAVILGYALATLMWRSSGMARAVLLAIILLPFWTSVLIKNFAWSFLLQDNGIINGTLMWIGLIETPLPLLHNRFAVIVGMVHYVLPFAVFPIFTVLISLDDRLESAAQSLGARGWAVLTEVTLPLARQGIYSATLLVFIISASFYVTPILLGSPRDMMVSNLVSFYSDTLVDFGSGSAASVLILLAASVLIWIYQTLPKGGQHG